MPCCETIGADGSGLGDICGSPPATSSETLFAGADLISGSERISDGTGDSELPNGTDDKSSSKKTGLFASASSGITGADDTIDGGRAARFGGAASNVSTPLTSGRGAAVDADCVGWGVGVAAVNALPHQLHLSAVSLSSPHHLQNIQHLPNCCGHL